MTLKEMFNKIEAYNEVAEMLNEDKAMIVFYTEDAGYRFVEQFATYDDFQSFVNGEYIDAMAEAVINSDEWGFNKETKITCSDRWGDHTRVFGIDLVSKRR